MSLLRNDRKRRYRRGWAIHAYVGPNGGGKTAAAVWDTMPSLAAGRPALSTVRLLDWEKPRDCDDPACDSPDHDGRWLEHPITGESYWKPPHKAAHPLWIPWTNWKQLLEVEYCDVIADEVTGVASSRESLSMPGVISNALPQLRRKDVTFRWTAPNWARADVIIRECTQAATLCSGYFPVKVDSDDGLDRAWRHRRLFRWKTYDALLVDELTEGKRDDIGADQMDLFWGPGSEVFDAYDTFDTVSSLMKASDSGRCLECHGRRSPEPCTCADYVGRRSRRGAGGGPARKRSEDGGPARDEDDGHVSHDHGGSSALITLGMAGSDLHPKRNGDRLPSDPRFSTPSPEGRQAERVGTNGSGN